MNERMNITIPKEEAGEAITALEDQGFNAKLEGDVPSQDLTDIYEALEEMTPPEVRLARQLLGEMHRLWEGLVSHEERILRIQDDLDEAYSVKNRMRVIEGALEEVILRVEELRGTAPAPKKRKPAVRGVYCRNCAKLLEGRQKVFCTRKCAAIWHGQHQGEIAQPRLQIKDEFEATVVAGEGVRDNGKEKEPVAV